MTLQSMTGFGSVSGEFQGITWIWEARSVNGRGLDVRLRYPEGAEVLEPVVRAAFAKSLSRGNVSVNLKMSRSEDDLIPSLNHDNLVAVVSAAQQARNIAEAQGLEMAAVTAGDLLAQRWVWETSKPVDPKWINIAKAQINDLVKALVEARISEGKAIVSMLEGQIKTLGELASASRKAANERNAKAGGILREKVLALLEITDIADEDRLAQELATLAVKADVTEELDRLDAHIVAAGKLLQENGPIGRKFDFLMQEFNREANTLCSKSGSTDLTAIGLELKLVIDQMREQVQNLE